jgi:hypothetical protein
MESFDLGILGFLSIMGLLKGRTSLFDQSSQKRDNINEDAEYFCDHRNLERNGN